MSDKGQLDKTGTVIVFADGSSCPRIPDGTPQSEWDHWPRESREYAESGLTPAPWVDPKLSDPPPTVEQELAKTDKDMARVAEDWIAALAATNPEAVAWLKDPANGRVAAVDKVNARRALRGEPPL